MVWDAVWSGTKLCRFRGAHCLYLQCRNGKLTDVSFQNLPESSINTGLFISPSGISELDCATTKKDTAERSISIGRESLQVFFVLRALAYFQVPPLGGSREEKWRSQWIRKRSVSWNLQNWVNCDCNFINVLSYLMTVLHHLATYVTEQTKHFCSFEE